LIKYLDIHAFVLFFAFFKDFLLAITLKIFNARNEIQIFFVYLNQIHYDYQVNISTNQILRMNLF